MKGNSRTPVEISDDSSSDKELVGNALDQLKKDLLKCLDKIQTTGHVATSKQHGSYVNPGLMVADTLIPLPLVPRDAETIRSVSRQAPFGKGDETVVDTSVRKTWELDHSQFRCANPDWEAYVSLLLDDASRSLAMSGVKAEPYKLLLYDEGSFFKRHKDSEKIPGMIGTLVICLPSKHDGGSVHLSHGGKDYVFDTDKTSDFGLTSLAWFSDVTHEVTPLKSGYRLVLTYNIIHEGGTRMSAGLVGKQSANLRAVLTKWKSTLPRRDKLVYMLEHKYTQSSLSLSNLKGRDRTVCQSLYEVGLDCGFMIFLARMTRTQSEDSYYDYNDCEEEETELKEVKTCDGQTLCGNMEVEEEDILGTDLWGRDPDSEEEAEGYMGNESMPSTLRYHDTVVIIVPVNELRSFLYQPDPRGIMSLINQALSDRPDNQLLLTSLLEILGKTLRKGSVDGTLLSNILAVAIKSENKTLYRQVVRACLKSPDARHQILKTIVRLAKERHMKDPHEKPDWDFWLSDLVTGTSDLSLTIFQKTLNYLDSLFQDNDLKDLKSSIEEWKTPILAKMVELKSSLTTDDYDFLICLLFTRSRDTSWLRDWFTPILSSRGSKQLVCALLRAVYDKRDTKILRKATDTFQCILEASVEKLTLGIGDFPYPGWSSRDHGIKSVEALLVSGVLEVIDQAFDLGLTQPATRLLDVSCINIHQSCPKPKAKKSFPCFIVIQHFLESLIVVLRKHQVPPLVSVKDMYITLLRTMLVADPPKRPTTPRGFTHKPRKCGEPCQDCNELNTFLKDSKARTHVFRMAEKRRRHLECLLPPQFFQCDTDKSRTPYGLVVTKLGKESQKDMQDYKDKLAAFEARVRGLRCEELKSLLGEELYNELVMLKNVPDSDGAKQLEGAGKKRKAKGELEASNSQRLKVEE
ncbi:hypothetical protein F4776DRAFT_634580 [Hypoxylon sp. NC0597]|nr:hypothetical protein F4776DRAFT_634580 [Hypoxylon sp. NC0597]